MRVGDSHRFERFHGKPQRLLAGDLAVRANAVRQLLADAHEGVELLAGLGRGEGDLDAADVP